MGAMSTRAALRASTTCCVAAAALALAASYGPLLHVYGRPAGGQLHMAALSTGRELVSSTVSVQQLAQLSSGLWGPLADESVVFGAVLLAIAGLGANLVSATRWNRVVVPCVALGGIALLSFGIAHATSSVGLGWEASAWVTWAPGAWMCMVSAVLGAIGLVSLAIAARADPSALLTPDVKGSERQHSLDVAQVG